MQIVFKNKTKFRNNFYVKHQIPKDFTFGVVYKFQCGPSSKSYYGEYVQQLNVRVGEHIGTSPLTKQQLAKM